MAWFGAKTWYRWHTAPLPEGPTDQYEERVVLFEAPTFEVALARAEAEARQYAEHAGPMLYLGAVNVFELFESPGDEAEVYSAVRTSALPPADFLQRYHDVESLHSQVVDAPPGEHDAAS